MCGIAGIFSKVALSVDNIRAMTESLAHRGPDASGYFNDTFVSLGHRRLSVLDLDARSHQPFFSQDKRYVIVFNGEIYNFKQIADELRGNGLVLKTTSDTEVLIEAFAIWGVDFVHKLNGMFAFSIYDTHENKLYLFRDRAGKKPLFYYLRDGMLIFASELKALLKHYVVSSSLSIDKSTISDFLQLGYIPQPKTFYKDIYKFPSGHYATFSPNLQFVLHQYWDLPQKINSIRMPDEPNTFNQLKLLVEDAVQSRLVADVPVGIFLSGGIDSSLVAAIASKATARLKTFSIGFKESKFDESVYSQQVSDHLGTDHYRYVLEENDAVEMVDQYLNHFDEPFADTSAIPTMLISRLARKEVTVALTGDGGDELFLGYGSYTWAQRLANPWWKLSRPVLKEFLSLIPSSRWKRAAHLFDNVNKKDIRKHIFSQEQYFFSDDELRTNLLMDRSLFSTWEYNDLASLKNITEAERQALFDFQYYLKDDLLVKVDRASMLYGLECRCPLLDYRLAEFSINLPEHLKKRNGVSKYLLRKMLYEMVPEKYFNRPKWGFSIPLSQWMKNDLGYLLNYLEEDQLAKTNIFNPQFVKDLVVRFKKGEEYLYNRLWVLIIIQKYLLKHA